MCSSDLGVPEESQFRKNGYRWNSQQPVGQPDGEDGFVGISPIGSSPPVASSLFGRPMRKKPSRVMGVAASFANLFAGSKSNGTNAAMININHGSSEYSMSSLSKRKGKQPWSEAGLSVGTALADKPLPSAPSPSAVAQAGIGTRHRLSPEIEWGSPSSSRNPSQADSHSPVSSYCVLPPRTMSSSSSASTPSTDTGPGYELCPNCIGTAGVLHAENALNAAFSPGTTPLTSSSTLVVPTGSPSDSSPSHSSGSTHSPGGDSFLGADPILNPNIGTTGRKFPKRKAFRHAYIEKFWGEAGWQDVGT